MDVKVEEYGNEKASLMVKEYASYPKEENFNFEDFYKKIEARAHREFLSKILQYSCLGIISEQEKREKNV